MKVVTGIFLALVLTGIVFFSWREERTGVPIPTDYKNATYLIEGEFITLVDGRAETVVAPGSASTRITQYFGNDVVGDVNDDGLPDIVFLLTQHTAGSGTFYYVAVALQTTQGYRGTNTILLGDRIAPQTIEMMRDEIVINYADRRPDEPMTTAPSVGTTRRLVIEEEMLVEN